MEITQTKAEDKTYENETQESIQLKNIIDSKEAEMTAMLNANDSHKKLNGELRKEIDELKADNKKLAKQVEDLKIEAKEMLQYP